MNELSPGTRVRYTDGRTGVVRYNGTTHFSTGRWIGIELEDETGKNDGSVNGQRYFTCAAAHGMFVRPETIFTLLDDGSSPASEMPPTKAFNGIERRSRQSIMSAEAARRRQSLMGSGVSRSTPGSRSPTKSPTKPAPSRRTSSGHSTPRTASPSTTARTSNSSAKSHLSASGRSSMGPPPPPPPPPGSKGQIRQSLGGASARTKNTGVSLPASRTAARPSMLSANHSNLSKNQEQSQTRSTEGEEPPISPSMDVEEDCDEDQLPVSNTDADTRVADEGEVSTSKLSSRSPQSDNEVASVLVNAIATRPTEPKVKPATSRELEQLKAKYTIMERKRMEDRDRLRAVDTLKEERDKFETTMQKLQRKCLTQAQEISEWRRQLQESGAKMEELERGDAERGTEMEMVSLDKEMAEERLETTTEELEKLKEKFEELQLEAEIVRDENKELTSGMTSTERSSAGWVQMEKENRRLRDALVALRDMTQGTEAGLKTHLKELERDLSEVEGLKSEHEKAKADLSASRNAIQTLKENLDASENQELLVAELTDAKEALVDRLHGLSRDVEVLKAEIEDEQNLRASAEEGERLLQDEFEAVQGIARQRHQTILDKNNAILDRDETLSKFAGVVHDLQRELRSLKVSQQMSETEAKELSAASRDAMDLNRRLQDSAVQSRARTVESELTRIRAEDTAMHLSILEQFVPASFRGERDPILALLRFKRVASKADVLRTVLMPDMDSGLAIPQDQTYFSFDVMEKLQWVAVCCSRSHNFMQCCTTEDFSRFRGAHSEVEPVERLLDAMVDAARRRDFDWGQWTERFQRMLPLLSDLAEKTVPSVPATLAETVAGHMRMTQFFSEVGALELSLIRDFLQSKVVRHEEDQGPLDFMQETQRLLDRTRMGPVVAAKVGRVLEEHQKRSMTLGKDSLAMFERAETISMDMSKLLGALGQGLWKVLDDDTSGGENITFAKFSASLQTSAGHWVQKSTETRPEMTDILATVGELLSGLHSSLESLYSLVSNLSNYSEFERHPAPWTVRAKTLAEEKVVDPRMEQQLCKIQNEAHEQKAAINIKNKEIEEQGLKIEFLEARSKVLKENTVALQKLEKDLAEMVEQRDRAVTELEKAMKEKYETSRKHDEAGVRLAALDQTGLGDGALATMDGHTFPHFSADIDSLKEEVSSLQSAVRFLKVENHRLLHPASGSTSLPATNHAWLAANPLQTRVDSGKDRGTKATTTVFANEAKDIFSTLRQVSSVLKPLRLQRPDPSDAYPADGGHGDKKQTSWRPLKQTPRYIIARQREELETWMTWRDDLVQRCGPGRGARPRRKESASAGAKGIGMTGLPLSGTKNSRTTTPQQQLTLDHSVEIVGSPP